MNLNRLRVFHTVANLKSFTQASKALCLTQPGISKHIKQLETSLQVRLFDRLGKKVALTQAGETLFESTTNIFETIANTKEKIDDLKMLTGGKITIGASFTAGVHIIPEIIAHFSTAYPDVEIILDIALSHRIAEKVIANELDIGFIGAPYKDDRLVTNKLCDDKLVVIVPNDHPWRGKKSIRFRELADQPFILSKQGSGTRAIIEKQMARAGIQLKRKIEFGNTEAVKKSVAAGMGVSIISASAIRSEVAAGLIKTVDLSDCRLMRTFYFTLHKEKYQTKAVRTLIAFFKSEMIKKSKRK